MKIKEILLLFIIPFVLSINCDKLEETNKEICENKGGIYTQNICRENCQTRIPYRIIFDIMLVDGEECFIAGVKGECKAGLGCVTEKINNFWKRIK